MSWHAKITRYTDNQAEIAVHVDYYNSDPSEGGGVVHHEEAVFPAGTPARAIREEFAKRGRSARQTMGRARSKDPSLLGDVFAIDDV